MATDYATLEFTEAQDFLADKITLDTDTWRDVSNDAHDAFFVSAGFKGSVLSEIREAVETAIQTGQRPEEFRQTFDRITQGWDYFGGPGWRADLIYRTNLRTAYGRGREEYQYDPEVLKVMPYLQFQHSDAENPRQLHLSLDQQVFPAREVPFSLPNGYGCGCTYTSLSERQLERRGLQMSDVRRGGTIGGVDVEPAEGWDKSPGMPRAEQRQRIIDQQLARMPAEIAAQVRAAIDGYSRAIDIPPPPPEPEPESEDESDASPD